MTTKLIVNKFSRVCILISFSLTQLFNCFNAFATQDPETLERIVQISIKHINPFHSEEFYTFMGEHPKYTEELLKRWYNLTPQELHSISQEYWPLLLDPGIMQRIDDFRGFLNSKYSADKLKRKLPYLTIRSSYSDTFQPISVKRGMWLTEDVAQNMMIHGMESNGIFNALRASGEKSIDNVYRTLFDEEDPEKIEHWYPASPLGAIEARMESMHFENVNTGTGALKASFLMSTTVYLDVALAVGSYYQVNEGHLYYFIIEMSALDFINPMLPGPLGIFLREEFKKLRKFWVQTYEPGNEVNTLYHMQDPGMEFFAMFKIEPEYLKKFARYDFPFPTIKIDKSGRTTARPQFRDSD